MIRRLNIRLLLFLLFETAVIASMVGVGWTLYRTYGLVQDLARQRGGPPPQPTTSQVQQVLMLEELRGKYLTLADRLVNGFRLINEGLDAFLKDRTVTIGRYLRETENLERRLAERSNDKVMLEAQSMRDEFLAHPVAKSDATLAVDLKYHDFLASVRTAVSNHIATLNITDGQPLSSNIVQLKISKAGPTERVVRSQIRSMGYTPAR